MIRKNSVRGPFMFLLFASTVPSAACADDVPEGFEEGATTDPATCQLELLQVSESVTIAVCPDEAEVADFMASSPLDGDSNESQPADIVLPQQPRSLTDSTPESCAWTPSIGATSANILGIECPGSSKPVSGACITTTHLTTSAPYEWNAFNVPEHNEYFQELGEPRSNPYEGWFCAKAPGGVQTGTVLCCS